jgi:two-component system alkaline phosphatase synthesis response regulator PhoP
LNCTFAIVELDFWFGLRAGAKFPPFPFFNMSMAARILLVDDDPDILELLEYNLSREGYAVMTATDPVVALELVNSFQPNLVVLDVMMPGINGFDVCMRIRTDHPGQEPAVFFMTSGEEKLQRLAFQSGGDDFIQKF